MTNTEEAGNTTNHEESTEEELHEEEIQEQEGIFQKMENYIRKRKKYLLIGGATLVGISAAIGGVHGLYDWATPERPAIVKEINEPYGKVLDVDYIRISEKREFIGSFPDDSDVEIHAHFGNERYAIVAPIKSINNESLLKELYRDVGTVEQNFTCFGKVSIERREAEKMVESSPNGIREYGIVLEPGNGETIIKVYNPDAIKWIETYTRGRPEYLPCCGDGQ